MTFGLFFVNFGKLGSARVRGPHPRLAEGNVNVAAAVLRHANTRIEPEGAGWKATNI
jgi:hypothetical protein